VLPQVPEPIKAKVVQFPEREAMHVSAFRPNQSEAGSIQRLPLGARDASLFGQDGEFEGRSWTFQTTLFPDVRMLGSPTPTRWEKA
jgi:hypothetical protein